jgi:hypothetical protein
MGCRFYFLPQRTQRIAKVCGGIFNTETQRLRVVTFVAGSFGD